MTTTVHVLGPLLLLPLLYANLGATQQVLLARLPRSVYGPPSYGWNTVSSFSPIGLGQMTKDELLTLLEAWQEVEEDTTPAPAPEPAETPAPPTKRPVKRPRPPPRPRPPVTEAPAPPPAPALPPPGAPVTVRLPAFVPIQLSAMFTPPATGGAVAGPGAGAGVVAGGGAGPGAVAAAGGAGAEAEEADADAEADARVGWGARKSTGWAVGGGTGWRAGETAALNYEHDFADHELIGQTQGEAKPRLFRYLSFPMTGAQPRPRHAHGPAPTQHVMRNTLESVDTGIAPLANLISVKSKHTNFRPPMSLPAPPPPQQPQHAAAHQMPIIRPKFVVPPPPPFLANAPGPLELVPSSQIFGNWRE